MFSGKRLSSTGDFEHRRTTVAYSSISTDPDNCINSPRNTIFRKLILPGGYFLCRNPPFEL